MRAAALLVPVLLVVGCGSTSHRPVTTAPAAKQPVRRRGVVRHREPRPLALPATLPRRVLTVPILMYHRVDLVKPTLPAITQRLTVDPRQFAAEMDWLKAHGFHAIDQLQLYRALELGRALPPRPVLITFDDGYRDVLGKAAPVLHRLDMAATAYVITGRISGPDPSFLTWGDLRTLERDGFDIGSHTVTHAELPNLSSAQATWQLETSRRVLERHLGRPMQWFSYPAGRFDARTVALVRAAGYVLAVTTQPGVAQSAAAPLELRRYEIQDTTGVGGLAALLGG